MSGKTKPKLYCADCTYHMCKNICAYQDTRNCCDGKCTLSKGRLSCQHKACKEYKLDEFFMEMGELLDELTD